MPQRSKKRLSLGRGWGLGGHVVQKASESGRIRPDPAKIVELRRILDHSRAEPAENSETQTYFGPPPTGFAVEPAEAGAPWGRSALQERVIDGAVVHYSAAQVVLVDARHLRGLQE